ncbi:MAG: nitronate monooxygenase family protein [Bacteroidales bacterium]|nr:nitronate monooxygenase family protein [Bacteroidales bacterium]
MENRVCKLFGIKYQIIQGGMVWCSGWKLASAVSKAGGLGLIGAGSMHPNNLRHHIRSCRDALEGKLPFGVNVPLLYPQIEEIIEIIVEEKVPIVFTSAGSPKKWTSHLQKQGIVVAHVVSSSLFARKCEEAGVDAVVAEGFEAGGHLGREETTTFCLIPQVSETISVPLIAAGGVASRASYNAAFALGAHGVQIGTRFALCEESSAHPSFKEYCRGLSEGGTKVLLKKIGATRMACNPFCEKVEEAEQSGVGPEQLKELLGSGRSKKGILEGDLIEGELEIGQITSMISKAETARQIIQDLVSS